MATEPNLTIPNPQSQTPPPASGPAAAARARVLYRHPTDRRLGGVCGGLGDYFDVDPVLIRILWILAALATGGAAILAYGVLWLVLPVGTARSGEREPAALSFDETNLARAAWVLIGLGLLWLLANTGILPGLWNSFWAVMAVLFWPAVLILAGLLLLRKSGRWGQDGSLAAGVKERVGDGASVRQTLRETRQRIPLKRPRHGRMLLGVCAGLARSFNVDTSIVRLLWALFSIGSMGTGVIVYVLLALVLPEDEATALEVVEGEILDPVR